MTAGPTGSGTIWSLQSLRFAAAMMVVYFHVANASLIATYSFGFLPRNFELVGRAGVDIFFVLSGVIIATTARRLTWREFAWRRFRRVVPMYLLISVPIALVVAKTSFGWRDAVATLFLWPATDRMTMPALAAAWTLCFEMLFYVAVTAVLVDRRLLLLCAALFAAAMALRARGPIFQFLGNPIIFEFIFGVALSYLPRGRLATWCLPIGGAALVATGFIGIAPPIQVNELLAGDESFQRVLVYGVPAAMIVFGAMQIDAKPSAWTFLGVRLTRCTSATCCPFSCFCYGGRPIRRRLRSLLRPAPWCPSSLLGGCTCSSRFRCSDCSAVEMKRHRRSARQPEDRSTGVVHWGGLRG